MRRFFSAFFCFGLLFASTASAADAEPVKLRLGGFMKWYAAAAYNENVPAGYDYNRFDLIGDLEVYFKGETALSDGFKIGVMAQLEGGTDDSYKKRQWDEVYLYADTLYGRFFMGDVKNAGEKLSVTAPSTSFLSVSDGDFEYLMPVPEDVSYLNAPFMKSPDSLAPKLMYFSPSVNGLMIGVSVSGASNANGHDSSVLYPENNSSTGVKIKNGVSAALLYEYENEGGDFGVSLSATYSGYKPNDVLSHSLHDFALGANVSFHNWTVGGAVRRSKADVRSAYADLQGYRWEAGVLYDAARWSASVNVAVSKVRGDVNVRGDDDYALYVASYKYRLGAGVDFFAEAGYTDADDETGLDTLSNKAFGSVAGIALSF